MKFAFALLALAAAQDDYATEPAAVQEPVAQEPAEYTESQQEFQFHGYSRPIATKLCLGNCPSGNYCQDKETGACHEPETQYASDGEYGQKIVGEHCADGTINLHCSRSGSRIALWIAFGLLFGPAIYFWHLTFHDELYNKPEPKGTVYAFANGIAGVKEARFIAFAIVFIASLAYLAMALGYGYTVKCCNGHHFYYARYIDWFLTTPLMLIEILKRTEVDSHVYFFVVFADMVMIVAGLIGSLVCGKERWIFFAFAMLAFLPVIYFLWDVLKRVRHSEVFLPSFKRAVFITITTWSLYPLVWILADGATNVLCARGESIFYTVLDVLAKTVFGFILVQHKANFHYTADSSPPASSFL